MTTLSELHATLLSEPLLPGRHVPGKPSQILRLQSKGTSAPVVAIHDAALFHTLAQRLGPDRPFTALQLIDPEMRPHPPNRSLEAIASDYARLLRKAQPHGPYVLVGWHTAGVIAYEVAQQLRAAGEHIRLLVMIDSRAPGAANRRGGWTRRLARLSTRFPVFDADRQPRDPCLFDTAEAHERRYRPLPYGGDVLVFRRSGTRLDATLGWRRFVTGKLDRRDVPGDPSGVLGEPGAGIIAKHIADTLARPG